MEGNRGSLIKIANFALIIVIVGKVLGLIKQISLSSAFGTTLDTDIVNLSSESVSTIQYIFSQMIFSAYVIVYLKAKQIDVCREKKFIRDSALLFAIIGIALSCFVFAFSSLIAKVLAPGYSLDNQQKLSYYLRLFSCLLTPSIFISFFETLLNANERFVQKETTTCIQNITITLYVILVGSSLGIKGLVSSHFVNVIVVLVYLSICVFPIIRGARIHQFYLPWKSDDIRALIKMMLPMLISYSMVYLNQYVDKMLASGMESGSISALGYGSSLSNMLISLFASVISVSYTRSSTYVNENQNEKAEELVFSFTSLLCHIGIPASIVFYICSDDIVTLLFMRGAFDEKSVIMTSAALKGYSVCFVPYIIKNIFSKYQYSFQKAKLPMIFGIAGIALNIVLSIILSRHIGLLGIALASSIAEVAAAILNYYAATRLNKYVPRRKYLKRAEVTIITFIPTIVLAIFISHRLTNFSAFPRLLIITSVVLFVYITLNLKNIVTLIKCIRKI